ncbi:MAG: hypothetical protein ACXU8N_03035 [Telluria sp.]|jgi:hypothetical protein
MKVRKNLEGVFLVAVAMTVFVTYASAMPMPRHKPTLIDAVETTDNPAIPTVVVKGHRLSAQEKAAEK